MSGEGKVNFYCSDRNCLLPCGRMINSLAKPGKKMDKAAKEFLSKGKIHYKDLVSKNRRQYEATVEMVDPGEGKCAVQSDFPQR